MARALIVGHDSELGKIITSHLTQCGWEVHGTTRRIELVSNTIHYLDSCSYESIEKSVDAFLREVRDWDLVVIAIGVLSPIGQITSVDFFEWKKSFEINFLSQIFLIQYILKKSEQFQKKNRKILTFAGSGTNSAPVNFSAYTLAKIGLVKAMELLTAEFPNYTFLSLGTGWMKSPIHDQTLAAGPTAGIAYDETRRRLADDDFGNPKMLTSFIDWFTQCSNREISGRNIALQGDDWQNPEFLDSLTRTEHSFKLRKFR